MPNPGENPKKYQINIHCTKEGEWYLKSLTINADTKEEFKEILEEARRVIKFGFNESFLPEGNTINLAKKKDKKEPKQEIILNNEDQKLYKKLISKRNDLANEKNLPSYVIAHNRLCI